MYPGESVVHIDRFTVRADRVVCELTLAPQTPHYVTPELMAQVRAAFPDIAQHCCVNERGDTFGAVMNHTSVPHVLEHLVISLQVRTTANSQGAVVGAQDAVGANSDTVFVGTTEWVNEAQGRARIEVSFTDDLVALRAFRDAIQFLSGILIR